LKTLSYLKKTRGDTIEGKIIPESPYCLIPKEVGTSSFKGGRLRGGFEEIIGFFSLTSNSF
jgi:hypothetical protein